MIEIGKKVKLPDPTSITCHPPQWTQKIPKMTKVGKETGRSLS